MRKLRRLISAILPYRIKAGLKAALRPSESTAESCRLEFVRSGGFEVVYRPGTCDESVLADSFDHDIFLPAVPEYHIGCDHVIIDVGAHIGTFSLLAAKGAPAGKVFAIEACRETFNLLYLNVKLNALSNVDMSHLALSDRVGKVYLHYDRENWGHTIVRPLGIDGELVQADTLTNFLQDKGIDRCHFMKFNCEGAEFPILLGTSKDVLQRIDTMLVLYHCDLYSGADETSLISHLQSAGFKALVRNRQPLRGWIIATREGAR